VADAEKEEQEKEDGEKRERQQRDERERRRIYAGRRIAEKRRLEADQFLLLPAVYGRWEIRGERDFTEQEERIDRYSGYMSRFCLGGVLE
jgi:hypothetical protein